MKRRMRWVRNRKEAIFLFIFAFLFLFLIVLENNEITNLGYKITGQEDELKEEKTKNANLTIEITNLSSPQRIEELARSYGLVGVKPEQITFLPDVTVEEKKKEMMEPFSLLVRIFERGIEARER
ncbi:MAG: septum formation initiator family protein [bacterium]